MKTRRIRRDRAWGCRPIRRPDSLASSDDGRPRPRPATDGIRERALDDAREPTDRRHVASLAMHDEGPVKLPVLDGSDMHARGVPFHEYRP